MKKTVLFIGGHHDGRWMSVDTAEFPVVVFESKDNRGVRRMLHPGDTAPERPSYEKEYYYRTRLGCETVYLAQTWEVDRSIARLIEYYRPLPDRLSWAREPKTDHA